MCPRLYTFRGSITRPASSLTPASSSHCWAGTWRALLTCWLGVRQVGLEPSGSHPLGNNNQFHGISPIPKVSGLPWREQALVRQGFGRDHPQGFSPLRGSRVNRLSPSDPGCCSSIKLSGECPVRVMRKEPFYLMPCDSRGGETWDLRPTEERHRACFMTCCGTASH